MGDHVVVHEDRLIDSQEVETKEEGQRSPSSSSVPVPFSVGCGNEKGMDEMVVAEKEEPLIQIVECRICQEEDHVKNLETPCACSGSIKYAHRGCVQRWCNGKGDIICEICHETYKPDYTAPLRPPPVETTIDMTAITGAPIYLRDLLILARPTAQPHFLEAESDEHASTNSWCTRICNLALLIFAGLVLLFNIITIVAFIFLGRELQEFLR